MKMNAPVTGTRTVFPVRLWRLVTAASRSSPSNSVTICSIMNRIFGLARACSTAHGWAWKWSNSWRIVTEEAYFVRETASSRAELPPPITAMSCPAKKSPSQVAQ